MGRHPDALVAEFFNRGDKIQDTSNRYHHTCKACGKQFAKGRVESLHLHIRAKCPSISAEDRARVTAVLDRRSQGSREGRRSGSTGIGDEDDALSRPGNAPGRPPMTALDTLAEVSRQRLDEQDRLDTRAQDGSSSRKRKRISSGPSSLADAPEVDLIDPSLRQQIESLLPMQEGEVHMAADPLSSISVTVNPRTSDPSQSVSTSSKDSWGFGAPTRPVVGSMMKLFRGPSSIEATLDSNTQRPSFAPSQADAGANFHHFSIHDDEELKAVKSRQKFTPDRRKEVHSIRTQGACIRCKVLKKPCSESTPCASCLSIDDARVWKAPCIRGRIADIFELYTCGLHKLIADKEVTKARAETHFERSSMLIEGTYFRGEPVPPFRLPSLQASSTSSSSPISTETPNHSTTVERFHIIDPDIESIFKLSQVYTQLHDYVRHAWRSLIARPTSEFLRPTLLLAIEVAERWPASLMTGALDLWALTECCVNPLLTGQILLVAPDAPSPNTTGSFSGSALSEPLPGFTLDAESNRLIPLQIRQYFDKLCAHYWKTLVGDLEQRLVHKQALGTADEKTEIFLVTVLILNCVEKMCWQFSLWITPEEVESQPQPAHTPEAESSSTSQTAKWPLPTSPEVLVAKGAVITEVLTMLLRTRNVLPHLIVDENDVLRHESSTTEYLIVVCPSALRILQPEPS